MIKKCKGNTEMKLLKLGTIAITLLNISTMTMAAPVQWSGNGNWYEAISVSGGISWTDASTTANAKGGYLATLTSGAENDFVFSLIDNPSFWNAEPAGSNLGPWLGGYQTSDIDASSASAANNWAWVTGEVWSYTNWSSGEPNNFEGAGEDYLSFKCYPNGCRSGQWNDLPDVISVLDTQVVAYVVEYDVNPVPVPAALWLFGSGLLALIGVSRRRK